MTETAPITEPGVYANLSRSDYARIPAVSQSVLKHFRKTPAHAKAAMDFPAEPTDAMRLGTLIHAYLLEPDRFASRYVVLPDLTLGLTRDDGTAYANPRATKEYKARRARFGAENIGKLFIEAHERDMCMAIGEAIAGHETAAGLLSARGEAELAIVWRDQETGTLCKALIDRLADNWAEWIAVDLKTAEDAGPFAFSRDALKLGHHLQTAFYLWGLSCVGKAAHRFLHIVCEKERPHGVAVYELDDESVDQGLRDVREYLKQYARCVETGRWPCYPQEIQPCRIPRYGFTPEE